MLCSSLILVAILPIFMDIVHFIPKNNLRWFPLLLLLSPTILSVAGTQHVLTVYRWVHSHYLLAVGSGFTPTTCLVENFIPLLGKSQSSHNTTISLFLLTTNPRKSLISSLPNMHQIVPTNFLPILVSGHTQKSIS